MTNREKTNRNMLERHLGLFKTPPLQEMRQAEQRILDRLRSGIVDTFDEPAATVDPVRPKWMPTILSISAAAAAIALGLVIGIPGTRHSQPGIDANAVVSVRSDGKGGRILDLADGSRIEARPDTKLSLERADDGIRINLNSGGVIITAAKQRNGHLYVRTKDVTVSVVGTVFLVNTEEAGSRVAVVEGEVQVQQGTVSKKLLPGEQVATNPVMPAVPVVEELAWSQNAAAHIALLQQSLALLQQAAAVQTQPVQIPNDAFEVASVRPTGLIPSGGRGFGGSNVSSRPAGEPCGSPSYPQLDPRRFSTSDSTLLELILWAYGKDCLIWHGSDFVIGGPQWIRSDGFDIQAVIPEGTASYTQEQFRNHEAPQVQMMLQKLLADRFKLVVRRELKETAGYDLSVAPSGSKLIAWKEGEGRGAGITGSYHDGQITSIIVGSKVSVAQLAKFLSQETRRPVQDRTGIVGEFKFRLDFAPLFTDTPMFLLHPDGSAAGPSLFTVVQEQLGLKLESTRVPVEFLTVEHVEKPAEN